MPDLLNKQAIVNLLIDSPLREPIKINLIDIVNNTNEPDLPKVYSTITKELEIFQKATERRMKLAEETIAKLGGVTGGDPSVAPVVNTPTSAPTTQPVTPVADTPSPVVAPPVMAPVETPTQILPVAPLDLPPIAQMPTLTPTEPPVTTPAAAPVATDATATPNFQPLGGAPASASSDEDALAEIQKELDSLKTEAASDVASAAAPKPAPQA